MVIKLHLNVIFNYKTSSADLSCIRADSLDEGFEIACLSRSNKIKGEKSVVVMCCSFFSLRDVDRGRLARAFRT